MVRGRVLDVGAGVGSISLILQEAGMDGDRGGGDPGGRRIMEARGVQDVRGGEGSGSAAGRGASTPSCSS